MAAQAEKLARILGWLAIITIIVLSVVPGDERPHTGASGHYEHVVAYLITAALLTFSYNARHSPVVIAVGLSFLSGLMEILQIYIPGRHAGFDDFAASSVGVVIGLALTWFFLRYCRRA
jgi:VanZ family protein